MKKLIQIPHRFLCRNYQIPAWEAQLNGYKRFVLCWHRGCGKDLFALNYAISEAMERPGVYLHCFPNYSQGKRAIWKSVHDTHDGDSMGYLDHIPEELIKSKNSSEMMIELINGSIYCVMGIDGKNAQRARGMNPCFVILSEYAYMDPLSWDTIEPRVSQNNGKALFISTPNGQNHFYNLFNVAKANPEDYFSSLLTIDDTKVLPEDYIDKRRKEGVPEDFIQQEYYCSFTRGAEGSYYGKLIQRCRDENRLVNIPIMPDLPCHTGWDIGIKDSTSIWIFQELRNGQINFIHYYENQGEGLEHYTTYLTEWKQKNRIQWGSHFVPHDMKNREFTSGVDRLSSARGFGYDMRVVPDKSIAEGIQAVRSTIPICFFHQDNCKKGIQCLDFYRKKYNDVLKTYYETPMHDQWSHGADAFRYACIGLRALGTENSLSVENDMKALNKYWG